MIAYDSSDTNRTDYRKRKLSCVGMSSSITMSLLPSFGWDLKVKSSGYKPEGA